MAQVLTPVKSSLFSPSSSSDESIESPSLFTIPPSPFMTKLGCGTGVSVYRLKRSIQSQGISKSPWAVKKVNSKARPNISERLAVEASFLKQLNHPNIVGFRAISGGANGDFCLAMEDCERSLMDIIDERVFLNEIFTFEETLKVAWSVAKALKYLHDEQKILHGDLKSGNILVRGHFDAVKLCDFGVSLRLKDDLSGLKNPTDRYIGSEPWKCKEALNQSKGAAITDRADVFAYGLVIYEMLTLSVPHVDLLGTCTNNDTSMTDEDDEEDPEEYLEAIGTRPPLPEEDIDMEVFAPFIELFCCCTNENPQERPSAAQIMQALLPHVLAAKLES